MKRVGNLTQLIADTDNLLLAFYKAKLGKHKSSEVLRFNKNLEENIAELSEEILSGNISVGKYEFFYIKDPKLRLICAASFRERVLHHAIMNICHPYFERNLIETTYATRPEKGIYQAIYRARIAMKRHKFVAKFDFRKYFDTISHDILQEKLQRLFKDDRLLSMMSKIIESYSKSEGNGIPIGNLTSQYFANYYLSDMDHYIKEVLKVPEYIRYMDDFLVFSDEYETLEYNIMKIKEFSENNLSLVLKPIIKGKTVNGVDFLGYNVGSNKILLNKRSKKRFIKKNRVYGNMIDFGFWNEKEYYEHITPLLSYVMKAYSKGLRGRCYGMSKSGSNRVLRGGSWNNNARNCRVSNRNNNNPDNRNNNNGFRLALVH